MDAQPERASGAPLRGGPHGAYAAVMATGIVSVAAAEDGIAWLSWALAVVAACLYVALAPRAVRCLRVGDESFAVVAATSVLGARSALAGWHAAAIGFWGAALALWVAFWLRRPRPAVATGTRLLAAVATQSVAVVAVLADRRLAPAGLVLFGLGLALYVQRASGLEPGELRRSDGEVWVAMGALAISALAAAELALRLGGTSLRDTALALWAAASCWIPPLASAEARWPRPRFAPARWSTVFPLGMYASASEAAAQATGVDALAAVSQVALWVAVAAWLAAAAGRLRRSFRTSGRVPDRPERRSAEIPGPPARPP